MLKTVTCVIFLFLLSMLSSAQKLSIPELQKIRSLKNTERTQYLAARNYVQGITRTENGLQEFVYRCFILEDNKSALKTVRVVVSDKLPTTLIIYNISDSLEARDLQDWLQKHSVKVDQVAVEGRQESFYRSKKGLVRYFSVIDSLSDGSKYTDFTFSIEY